MPDFGILRGIRRAKVTRGTLTEAERAAKAARDAAAEAEREKAVTVGSQAAVEDLEQIEGLEQAIGTPPPPSPAAAGFPTRGALIGSVDRARAAREGRGGPPAPVQAETLAGPPEGPVALQGAKDVDVEAARLTKLELGAYDLEADWQVNFDTLQTTDDVKALVADTAERYRGRIQESRRGTITHEQLTKLAADLNVEVDVIRPIMERNTGAAVNAETILGARKVLAESAGTVLSLAKKIASGQATDLERIRFRRQLQFHDDYQVAFMGARAEAGRAVNAFNIPIGAELDPEWLAKARRTVDSVNGNDTDMLAQKIAQLESVGQISKVSRQYARSKVAGTLQELFVNSILSGPTTHVVNTVGNALFQTMNTAEYAIAAQVGKVLPGADHVMAGEASAMLFGQLTGFRDSMRYAWLAFKNGEGVDNVTKIEGHTRRAISSHNLFPKGGPPSVAAGVDLLGSVIRFPTERVMLPTDEFFRTMAYRGDLARQAYREVNQRLAGGKGMTQDEIADFVRNYMEDPGISARKKAENFADYVTFQNELGISGKAAQRWAQTTPGAFIIAPFIRTPVQIFKAGLLERTPLAIFSNNFREALAKGGPERDLAVARVAMGTLTIGTIAAATASGRVTGGGPQDPGARRLLESTGWQPYSIVYEDDEGNLKYQSYARAEPFAYIVGATADAVEIRAFMDAEDPLGDEDENFNNAVASVTAAVANNTMSKTFLSGVADFSQALDDPSRYMEGWIARSTQAFIPFSAFRRQVGKVQDPLVREAWSYNDKLKAGSGLAGYSEGLPPKRGVFGEPVEWKAGSLLGVLDPFPVTTGTDDRVADQIVAVMQETGSIPVTMPSKRIEGLKLSAEEYDQLVLASRAEPNMGGKTFRERLDDLIGSTTYLLATPDMRSQLIKSVRENADKVGRAVLERDNEEFALRLELHRLKKNELLQGLPQ